MQQFRWLSHVVWIGTLSHVGSQMRCEAVSSACLQETTNDPASFQDFQIFPELSALNCWMTLGPELVLLYPRISMRTELDAGVVRK